MVDDWWWKIMKTVKCVGVLVPTVLVCCPLLCLCVSPSVFVWWRHSCTLMSWTRVPEFKSWPQFWLNSALESLCVWNEFPKEKMGHTPHSLHTCSGMMCSPCICSGEVQVKERCRSSALFVHTLWLSALHMHLLWWGAGWVCILCTHSAEVQFASAWICCFN